MQLESFLRQLAVYLAFAAQTWAIPTVRVATTAAFNAGPYLLELVETAAGENSSAYFALLDGVAGGSFSAASTDSDLYHQFVERLQGDGHITSPEALSTFNLALSLRTAAPRIEAHYQYYETSVQPLIHENCDTWVLIDGKQFCSAEFDVENKAGLLSISTRILPFDRVLGSGREAVLYADPVSDEFAIFHQRLSRAARSGELSYRVRYRRGRAAPEKPLHVSGYGVELALKKTDYIVLDDRFASESAQKRISTEKDILEEDQDDVFELKPLSASELAPIGMKAASLIQQSESPFESLVKLSGDFPKYVSSIALHNISDKFATELEELRTHHVRDGLNFLWINGAQLIDRQVEPFALVGILRRERKLVDGIRGLGFNADQAVDLLSHNAISSTKSDEDSTRYDWTDVAEDRRAIIWLNDLEKDERYESYPTSLFSLLHRTFPGQIPPIRKNMFHLVVPIDLSIIRDLELVVDLKMILQRGIPIRFGLVPLQSGEESKIRAKMAYLLAQNRGSEALLSYLELLVERVGETDIDIDDLVSTVAKAHPALPGSLPIPLRKVLSAEEFKDALIPASKWIARLHADAADRPLFVNGVVVSLNDNWMQKMSMVVGEDLQTIQKGLYHGVLDEDTSVPALFLDGATARRSMYLTSDDDKALRILSIAKLNEEYSSCFGALPFLDADSTAPRDSWTVVTVLADLTSVTGLALVQMALNYKRQDAGMRLEIMDMQENARIASQVIAAFRSGQHDLSRIQSEHDLKAVINKAADHEANEEFAQTRSRFLRNEGLQAASHFLIVNGRVVGPIVPDAPFTDEDFQLLIQYERLHRIEPVLTAVADLSLTELVSSPLTAAKLTSMIALSAKSDLPEGIFESAPSSRSTIYNAWNSSRISVQTGDPRTASVHIVGLLDPASEKAQRWAPIIKTIAALKGVYVKLILNPKIKTDELPVKRFFRFVLDAKPTFDQLGNVDRPVASFSRLPSEVLMTTRMDVPPAWLVAPKSSVHDLDNIKLSEIDEDVEALYKIEHILIEGHSREAKGSPPRGAQLVLATKTQPLLTDTIIMANLGFFQFKANPGFYHIRLKEGKSSDIYAIESIGAEGWEPVPGDEGTELALMDFQGATVYPRLKRRISMEDAEVLDDSPRPVNSNIVAKSLKLAEGLLGSVKGGHIAERGEHAEINIFSVASGHLYERMLNIMMVSVMRHTKHSVKFWFIEQFLSPSFKEFIPVLAENYGFKYEMVTYKWPHWLRQQKEKQREIWGYKILFLDVLFPLSLNKVIFVDADQVIRTDMMELVTLDLEGAPYGFTPMCDSRTEMEGFRFWKQGYWAQYLRGKPYHISALYVVDLRRFRELAAGDRLRQQYHALSADPASLSNLDQDLPNHMQFQIPIHSLPQEWLWCETWCSDADLARARTIDLCNNPLTKEPKLDRARRQVPEWTTYDAEIAALDPRRGRVLSSTDSLNGSSSTAVKLTRGAEHQQKDEL